MFILEVILDTFLIFIYLLLFFKVDLRERERNIDLLFHLFMHSLVESCTCPDRELNLQPWHIGTTLQPAELPSEDTFIIFRCLLCSSDFSIFMFFFCCFDFFSLCFLMIKEDKSQQLSQISVLFQFLCLPGNPCFTLMFKSYYLILFLLNC